MTPESEFEEDHNSNFLKGTSNLARTDLKRITQRSTGRQKQQRFYQLANYWLNNVIVSKVIPFLLLPPVSLVVRL